MHTYVLSYLLKFPLSQGHSTVDKADKAWCVQNPRLNPQHYINRAWWLILVIPTLGRQRQEESSSRYIVSLRPTWAVSKTEKQTNKP